MIKIALSFDDGRLDQYRTFMKILKQKNIPATLNITSGYVLNTIEKVDYPSEHKQMSKEQLLEIINESIFVIEGHGKKHNNEISNFVDGIDDLKNEFGVIVDGLASPQCRLNIGEIDKYKKEMDKYGIKYIRTGDRFYNQAFLKKVLRKINRVIKSSKIYNYVYSDSDVRANDKYILHSAIITKYDTLKMMKKFINNAVKNNKSYILMFHSILKPKEEFYSDTYTWDYYDFEDFCDYLIDLKNKKLITIITDKEYINQ